MWLSNVQIGWIILLAHGTTTFGFLTWIAVRLPLEVGSLDHTCKLYSKHALSNNLQDTVTFMLSEQPGHFL